MKWSVAESGLSRAEVICQRTPQCLGDETYDENLNGHFLNKLGKGIIIAKVVEVKLRIKLPLSGCLRDQIFYASFQGCGRRFEMPLNSFHSHIRTQQGRFPSMKFFLAERKAHSFLLFRTVVDEL